MSLFVWIVDRKQLVHFPTCLNSKVQCVDLESDKEVVPPKVEAPKTAAAAAPAVQGNTEKPNDAPVAAAPGQLAAAGLFILKVLESRNLVLPNGQKAVPGGPGGKDIGELTFAVIEMDKNEVLMRCIEGVPASGNGIWGTRAHFDISRNCKAAISVYQPGPNKLDVLIGNIILSPSFIDSV